MKRVTVARGLMTIAFGAAALWAVQLAAQSTARAEKCDPSNPDVCVGGPTGTMCGGEGEQCCNESDCGEDLVCSNDVCSRPPSYVRYRVICNSGHHFCLNGTSDREAALQRATQSCSYNGGVDLFTPYPYGPC
jgi:hypothetical protein